MKKFLVGFAILSISSLSLLAVQADGANYCLEEEYTNPVKFEAIRDSNIYGDAYEDSKYKKVKKGEVFNVYSIGKNCNNQEAVFMNADKESFTGLKMNDFIQIGKNDNSNITYNHDDFYNNNSNKNNDTSSNEEVIEITLKEIQNPFGRTLPLVPILYITSITDKITIKDVTVNRGNCQGINYAKSKLPKVLKYGQQIDYTIMAGCKVKEIKVITNMGERTFNVQ